VGSDEAIDLIIRIFCVPGKDKIIITPPTYGMYKVCAKTNDVGLVSVPLTPTFDIRVPEVRGWRWPRLHAHTPKAIAMEALDVSRCCPRLLCVANADPGRRDR
jgi:hypothetical protein